MPAIAMVLVVMLLGVLLWLLHRNDQEEERLTLIKDILWVEQNIHFHLSTDEEKLGQLATDLGRHSLSLDLLENAARTLIANNQEFDRFLLRGGDGRLSVSVPPSQGEPSGSVVGEPAPWWPAFLLARSTGRVAWSVPYFIPGRGAVFEAHVPVYQDHAFVAMLVAVVSVDAMLTHHVPWWVAEKYKIEIIDSSGVVLGAKTGVELAEPGASHQVRLEPPGQGLAVVATVYDPEGKLARNVLAASIFILALLALSSLGLVRRHVRRRLAAEQALGEEHAFRKAMEDSLTVGMRARDLDGRVTYVNPAFCRMVGWNADELVGIIPPMPYWVPELLDETMLMHRQVLAGKAPRDGFEIQFRRRSGETFWALIYEAPLIDANGRHTGWMASVVDITERKASEEMAHQQQEKLQRTSRLITMGEMASTLAHELNQPLSAIASYATGCLNRLGAESFTPEELRLPLSKLVAQAQRAGQIIRRVHDFVRKSEPQLRACSVPRLLAESLAFMELDAKKRGVAIVLRSESDSAVVDGDKVLLEQVILNLARNGIEAMSHLPASQRRLEVNLHADDGQALVSIRDFGSGIAPDVLENLFQPFFTTKEEGMGMGLNICRSIIEFHRGRLWFEPHPQGGSIFLFSLPLRNAA
ncbi:PAS domain S-box protein [Magnetospirillum sp. J10]|uniref:histidine kinase n=2 Tax=Magnetospirillum sulfuroxidans TaxID=611300 RepID=A0ABS5I9F8_9PROT|nr:PAS domain S-box protein [Magnetospirillum sulfuroxidans]MBR9971069.1 PAS domain S-box protein [Magnetospirillum sulfuroxidans]